jgi:iron-sulfur cluster assembly protein
MIQITESASKALLNNLNEEGLSRETHNLKVGVESGGCSGLQYFMKFSEKENDIDGNLLVKTETIDVLIDRRSVLYLAGTELHYSTGLNGKGFEWKNPNASRTCGCGESFSL